MVAFAFDSAADSTTPAAPPFLDFFGFLSLQPTIILRHMPHFFGSSGALGGASRAIAMIIGVVFNLGVVLNLSGILLLTFGATIIELGFGTSGSLVGGF
jgi:hypothetical protein